MLQDYELLQSPRYFSSDLGDVQASAEDNKKKNSSLFASVAQSCETFPWINFSENDLSTPDLQESPSCIHCFTPEPVIHNTAVTPTCRHQVSASNHCHSRTTLQQQQQQQSQFSKRRTYKHDCSHSSPDFCYSLSSNELSASLDHLHSKTTPRNCYSFKRKRKNCSYCVKQSTGRRNDSPPLLSEFLYHKNKKNHRTVYQRFQESSTSDAQFTSDNDTPFSQANLKSQDGNKRRYRNQSNDSKYERTYFTLSSKGKRKDSITKKANQHYNKNNRFIATPPKCPKNILQKGCLPLDLNLSPPSGDDQTTLSQSRTEYCLALTSPRSCSKRYLRSSSFVDLDSFRKTLTHFSFPIKNQDSSPMPSLLRLSPEPSHNKITAAAECLSAASNSANIFYENGYTEENSRSLVPFGHYQKQCLAAPIDVGQNSPSIMATTEENSTYTRRLLTALHQLKYDVGSTLCAYVHNVMNWTGLDGDEFTLDGYSPLDSDVCLLGINFTMDGGAINSWRGVEPANQCYNKIYKLKRNIVRGRKDFRVTGTESSHSTSKTPSSLGLKGINVRSEQIKKQLRTAMNSLTFMSYRRDFAPMYRLLKHQCCVDHDHNILKITSDAGWGCVLRCSQMLLFHTLKRYFLHQLAPTSQNSAYPKKEEKYYHEAFSKKLKRRSSNSVWTELEDEYDGEEEREKEETEIKMEQCEYDLSRKYKDFVSNDSNVSNSHKRQCISEKYDEQHYFCDIPSVRPYNRRLLENCETCMYEEREKSLWGTEKSSVSAYDISKVQVSSSASCCSGKLCNKQKLLEQAELDEKQLLNIDERQSNNRNEINSLPGPVEMCLLSLFLDLPTPPSEYPFSVYAFVRSAGGGLGWALNLYGSMPVESNILSSLVHRHRKLESASNESIQCKTTNEEMVMRRVVSLSCLQSKNRHLTTEAVLEKEKSCETLSNRFKQELMTKNGLLETQNDDLRDACNNNGYCATSYRYNKGYVIQHAIDETVCNYGQLMEDTQGIQSDDSQTIFLGKKPGDWFGPLSASYAIKYLVESCDLTQDDLAVYVNSEGLLNVEEAITSMLNRPHNREKKSKKFGFNCRSKRKPPNNASVKTGKQTMQRVPVKSINFNHNCSNVKLRKRSYVSLPSSNSKNCESFLKPRKKVSDLLTSRNEFEVGTAQQSVGGVHDCDEDWYFLSDASNYYFEDMMKKADPFKSLDITKKTNQKLKCSLSSPVIASFDKLHMSSRKLLELLNVKEINDECNSEHRKCSSKTKLKHCTKGLLLCFPLTLGKRLTSVQQHALARYFELPWFTGAIGSRNGKKQALYFIGKHESNKKLNYSFSSPPPPPAMTSRFKGLRRSSRSSYNSSNSVCSYKCNDYSASRRLKSAEEAAAAKRFYSFEPFSSETKCSSRLGKNKIELLYLDPHLVQASATNVITSWNTFHSPKVFKTPLSSLDPGLLLAFYCHTLNDLVGLAKTLSSVACAHKHRAPLFVDNEGCSRYENKRKKMICNKLGGSSCSSCFVVRMHRGLVVQGSKRFCQTKRKRSIIRQQGGARLIKKCIIGRSPNKSRHRDSEIQEGTSSGIFTERRNSDGFVVVNGVDSPRSDYMLICRSERDEKVVEYSGSRKSCRKYKQCFCNKLTRKQVESEKKKTENGHKIVSNEESDLVSHHILIRSDQNSEDIYVNDDVVSPVSTTCSSDVLCPACSNRENLSILPRKRCCASFKAPCLLKKFSSLLTTQGLFLQIIS